MGFKNVRFWSSYTLDYTLIIWQMPFYLFYFLYIPSVLHLYFTLPIHYMTLCSLWCFFFPVYLSISFFAPKTGESTTSYRSDLILSYVVRNLLSYCTDPASLCLRWLETYFCTVPTCRLLSGENLPYRHARSGFLPSVPLIGPFGPVPACDWTGRTGPNAPC